MLLRRGRGICVEPHHHRRPRGCLRDRRLRLRGHHHAVEPVFAISSGGLVAPATVVPADVWAYPRVYFGGGFAYLVNGAWYQETPRGWVVYRREPMSSPASGRASMPPPRGPPRASLPMGTRAPLLSRSRTSTGGRALPAPLTAGAPASRTGLGYAPPDEPFLFLHPGRGGRRGALALALAGPALANGRYPSAGQIAVAPGDPKVILVRATYGILLSRDAGHSWSWLCEKAVGYGSVEDPMMAYTADGTILAGNFKGLSIGSPDGCQWGFTPGGLANKYVIDLAVDKKDATKGVLVISNSTGQDDAGAPVFLTQLWQTADSGKTWTQAGVDLPPLFLGLTVDTAPSDPQRVYVSGRFGPPGYLGSIERSDDRGATWQPLPVTGADSTHLPYIGGIDPNNPDIVYVRLDADPTNQLLVSKDGAKTWTSVYTSAGKLYGFALSPDGSMVAIGGDKDGVLDRAGEHAPVHQGEQRRGQVPDLDGGRALRLRRRVQGRVHRGALHRPGQDLHPNHAPRRNLPPHVQRAGQRRERVLPRGLVGDRIDHQRHLRRRRGPDGRRVLRRRRRHARRRLLLRPGERRGRRPGRGLAGRPRGRVAAEPPGQAEPPPLSQPVLPPRLSSTDLNLLVAFDALVAEGNVTRAAARVGLTQPAMSHALGRLRKLLGDPLLVRTPQGMLPTPRAQELIGPIRHALREIDRALTQSPAFDPRMRAAPSRWPASTSDPLVVVPPLLARLRAEAPGADLHVRPFRGEAIGSKSPRASSTWASACSPTSSPEGR